MSTIIRANRVDDLEDGRVRDTYYVQRYMEQSKMLSLY